MAETLVLDPPEVSYNRAALDITAFVAEQGPDYGEAAIEQFMADGYRGQVPVDFKVPNRVITIPLVLHDTTGRSFVQIREFIQAKAGLMQREGGWLKRTVTGGVVYADVVGATLHFGGSTAQAISDVDADAILTLECIPDFYGDELALADHVETTNPELVFSETGIKGDFPGRTRLVVDDDQGVNQLGLIWGFRSRHYDNAQTARLAYRAVSMTPLDSASGASSIMVEHTTVGKGWTPVLSTSTSAGPMTHTGTYRVFARVVSGSGGADCAMRLVWDVGDMTNPAENRPWNFPKPAGSYFFNADLGEIRIDAIQAGTHRWIGHIQARALNEGAASVGIRDVWFVPVDDGFGRLSAASGNTTTLTAFSVRDDFNQTSGTLTGKTLQVGGTWGGAGDTDDFTINTTLHNAQRTAVSDTDHATGRYALAGSTNQANSAVYVLFAHSASTPAISGVLLRYIDVNNWLMGRIAPYAAGAVPVGDPGHVDSLAFEVWKRKAGTLTKISSITSGTTLGGTAWSIQLACDASGRYKLSAGPGQALDDLLVGQDSDLATGGTLASGRQGFYDASVNATANTRYYDFFGAWMPDPDAVVFANQSAQLTSAGMVREIALSGSFGPVSRVVGDLPRVPPAGLEGRPVEVFVKASRGNFDTLPDCVVNNIVADDISARLFYRPSWLFVPESGTGPPPTTGGLYPSPTLYPATDLFPEAP
jgi:hypothetical protein